MFSGVIYNVKTDQRGWSVERIVTILALYILKLLYILIILSANT